MNQRPGLPLPSDLRMPLRDVVRGLSGLAQMTEDVLAPAHASLPKPLQLALAEAVSVIKKGGTRLVAREIEFAEIEAAAQCVSGAEPARAASCAKVLAFAWDHLGSEAMVSETLLATHLTAQAEPTGGPHHAAARLVAELRTSRAFGTMPGLPMSISDQAGIDFRLVTAASWLLADREETLEGELRLLDLAASLTRAFQDDISGAIADEAALAALLKTLSAHL